MEAVIMQLPLLHTHVFDPLRHGSLHYVASLQNKSGELTALMESSTETWDRLTPLLHIVGPKDQQRPLTVPTVQGWIKRVAKAVGQHPCFLDIARLRASRPTGLKAEPVLSRLYSEVRKRQLQFVPVLPVENPSQGHLRQVRDALWQDGRGVALRYRALGTVSVVPPAELLARALEQLETDASSADLIIDLHWLSLDTEIDPEDIAFLIESLISEESWRNLIFLGTTMPSTLGCVKEGTMGLLPRREWRLWQGVRSKARTPLPTFGDYAIQHPRPPQDGPGGPGMRANIRYTTSDSTLVARGRGAVIQEGKWQYRQLCQNLSDHEEYKGPDYSWGDRLIKECASGIIDPGAQTMWRAVGTSHHLRFVTDQISALAV
jgi:hypothetical protein